MATNKVMTSPVPEDSPVVVIVKKMNFCEAISEVLLGKKVTKLEWGDPEYYLKLMNDKLVLHKPDGKFYDLIVSYGDMTGEDYMLV
jgi:hypothetical protein